LLNKAIMAKTSKANTKEKKEKKIHHHQKAKSEQ